MLRAIGIVVSAPTKKSVHPTAVHRLLYRVVHGNVEVARLLHDEMSFSNHLPIEWLLELVHIRAA